MAINRNNYEAYFYDYWDEALDPGREKSVLEFLNANPDLQDEFLLTRSLFLEAGQTTYPHKNSLKKEEIRPHGGIDENNYENFFISYWEGNLTEGERATVFAFTGINPFLKKEFEAFRYTFLQPETTTGFPFKNDLKRNPDVKTIWLFRIIPAAAAVALLAGVYLLLSDNAEQNSKRFDSVVIGRLEPLYYSPSVETLPVSLRNQGKSKLITLGTEENNLDTPIQYPVEEVITALETFRAKEILFDIDPLQYPAIHPQKSFSGNFQMFDTGRNAEERTVAGIFIRGFASKLKTLVPVKGRGAEKSFLELTVDGYNLIADRDVSVDKEMDENGQVTSMNLETRFFSYNRSISSHHQE
ncbi:MAG: hypothetical protein JXA03_10600 [Bacteroidales bacterium]|nr:hypothetical protein [Bacteroidales bacterium]